MSIDTTRAIRSSTLVYDKTRDPMVKVQSTVETTVRAIGHGQITVAHVTWAINCQLADRHEPTITAEQVHRALRSLARYQYLPLRSNGRGVYYYGKTVQPTLPA